MRSKLSLAFFLLFFTVCAAANEPEVILKSSRVSVSKDKIYLGDIADFQGLSDDAANRLSTLYIRSAALPGFSVKVTKENVTNQVKKEFRYIRISGPASVEVYTEKSAVSRDSIVDTAKKYVLDNMPWKKEDVEIEARGSHKDIDVVGGEVLLNVRDEKEQEWKGNMVVPVEITVGGKFYKTEPVSLLVKVVTDCLIASEDIRPREPLDNRVVMERRDLTYMPGRILTSPQQAAYKISKRGIAKGTILLADMFESAPVFRRGSIVSVVVKIHGISVETTGTSFDEGRDGGLAKVKLITGKTVEGKVSPDGKVIIEK
jgi:flagella basal body P-ring formation protein FlgA